MSGYRLTSLVCTTKHPSTSSTSASLYPVSPPDNTFALPTEVFSSCLAIVSAVMVGGLFLWPALRYGTGYQTVWETISRDSFRRSLETFFFQLTCVHSALELSGRCTLQIYLLTWCIPGFREWVQDKTAHTDDTYSSFSLLKRLVQMLVRIFVFILVNLSWCAEYYCIDFISSSSSSSSSLV